MKKIPVGLLGSTGQVGQQYQKLLANHPWFELQILAQIDDLENAKKCALVFSALGNDAAKIYEERYAENGIPVISNASHHRLAPDVPLLIPEVNGEHAKIIPVQKKNRGYGGFIVTKPNCTLQGIVMPLAPLHRRFGVRRLFVTTMQAISGAGYPGVASLDIVDNVIPFIAKEEEKTEIESLKVLGQIENGVIAPARGIAISAHCNRVPVIDGHLACVSVEFEAKPTMEEILKLWSAPQELKLPSAPAFPLLYRAEENRPQPRRDREAGSGMSVSVGRLRECPLLSYRFVALSHNTIRGAAGGAILSAELLVQEGYIG